jgi:aspartyl-tRNA(Asn)/glutamyl-tRNA(Gln) amidotransferase subunit C
VKLSESEVRYVAELANLRLTDAEAARMAHDLSDILTHIEKLNELDTAEVSPMAQVFSEAGETATLREDVEHTPLANADAVANAAQSGAGYFKVPKVIER